jgi:hypothetical protein
VLKLDSFFVLCQNFVQVRFCFLRLVFLLFCIFSSRKSLFIFLQFHVGRMFLRSLPRQRSTISASVDEGSVASSQPFSNDEESSECSSEVSLPSSSDSEELSLPSTDDEETLSQCGEAQVSVAGNDRNEIPNVDAAMLLTQCSDPGEAVLVAQCSEGHVAQTTGGVPGDDSIGHAFLTDESEALLNLQVFVNNSDQSVVDPR